MFNGSLGELYIKLTQYLLNKDKSISNNSATNCVQEIKNIFINN